MNLTVVIAEDEEPALAKLRRMLAALPAVTVIGEAREGQVAIELLRSRRPDVAFLDIKMPGCDGLSVVQSLPCPPKIVFVTAHPNFAASAFACRASDYLLKPYSVATLAAVVTRIREQLKLERLAQWMSRGRQLAPAVDGRRRIAVKMGQELILVPVSAIECVICEGNYLHILTAERKLFVRGALAALVRALDDSCFFPAGRGCILNLRHLASFSARERVAVTTSGYRASVSRPRARALLKAIQKLDAPIIGAR